MGYRERDREKGRQEEKKRNMKREKDINKEKDLVGNEREKEDSGTNLWRLCKVSGSDPGLWISVELIRIRIRPSKKTRNSIQA